LVAKKKALDAQVEVQTKKAKDFENTMRQKACSIGNIVARDVPVSMNEVRHCSGLGGCLFFTHFGDDRRMTM
jgi:seryl-tRNA synthetase